MGAVRLVVVNESMAHVVIQRKAVAGMSYSFFLDRPGLKEGYTVPLRLRVVDSIGQMVGLLSLIAAGFVAVLCSATLPAKLFDYPAVTLSMTFVVYLIMLLVMRFLHPVEIGIYKLAVRYSGLLSEEELRHIPLRYERGVVDPWPDEWQKPY